MQLDKVVAFHKALADPTRIRILFLLKSGPLHGQALAEKLGVSAPTITHHMAKLRQVALVKESRDKNTIFFELDQHVLEQKAKALYTALIETPLIREASTVDHNEHLKQSVLNNFFAKDGTLKQIPAQRKRKLIVFEHLLTGLGAGEKYTEQQINQHILRFHEDYCTIRREFIINHFMYRENGIYELNPPEMWADWRAL
jgi:hypothetical protein